MSALCLAVDDGRAQALIEPAAPIYEIPREKVVSASSLDVIDPDPIVDALPLDVIVFVVADERVRAEGSETTSKPLTVSRPLRLARARCRLRLTNATSNSLPNSFP